MAANCLPYDPQQSMLLPEALQEWLPEGHLAHFINDTVDGLDLSVQVVRLAREMGLVKLGMIAVDGTKVKANASRHKAMSYGHMLKAEAELKAQDNFTDPESRIMRRAGGGFDPAHNGQTAVDDKAHIIVAAELGNCAADVGELPRMPNAVKANVGAYPAQTLADAGYRSEAVFEQLADHTELIVALGREGKQHVAIDPAGLPRTVAMAAKMQTDETRDAYRRRKWLAEPPNGWIKNILGFRQFSMRGLSRVQAEWKLVCLALNLRRMASMQPT